MSVFIDETALLTNAVVASAVELSPDACVVAVEEAPAVKSPVNRAAFTYPLSEVASYPIDTFEENVPSPFEC